MRKAWTLAVLGSATVAGVAAVAVAATGGSPAAQVASPVASISHAPAGALVAHARAAVATTAVSGAALAATEPAGARPASGTTSLLVRFQHTASAAQQATAIAQHGGSQRAVIPALDLHVVDVATAHAAAVAAAYRADRAVRSVEVDSTRHARATPSDPSYAQQWALPQVGWDQLYGAVNPAGHATVAVLDTGVDGSHEDLQGRLVPGWSAFAGSDPATDPNGHGTWMAGIAAASTGNAAGVAGVAYAGVSIMPVQVLDATGIGQDSDIVNGVIWAADHGADVVVMSFSNTGFSQDLQDAISYAWSKGVVLVAATGNDASSTITYPAGDSYVMGVSGTDQNDALASESNFGADTFVAAPSEDVLTTDAGGGYRSISGTSASAAMVAGVAAFERALDGSLTNGAIDGRIARNAAPAGTQDQTGNGRLDMLRTVADTSTDPVVPPGADAQSSGTFVGPYSDAAAATDGSGTMTVTPSSVTAGSTGDSFAFTFRIPNKTGNFAGQTRLFIPAGWTQPQSTTSSGAGFVAIGNPSNCSTASINSISGSAATGWNVIVDTSCNSRKKYTLNYSHVTAPGAGTYTFTTATKLTSGTFTGIAHSPVVTVTPVGATATTTTLSRTAGTSPDLYGQSLTFTATVTASGGNPSTGEGTVDFADTGSGTDICVGVALSGNTATCTVNNLDAGGYSIQASYSGTTSAPAFAGSTSNTVNQTVNAAGTSTALASSDNPSTVADPVTFTATVSTTASGGTDPNGDGTVTFNDGSTPVCIAVALIGNVATCTTSSLSVGTHSMTAVYSPDSTIGDFTGSTSPTLSQQVHSGPATHFAVAGFPSPTTAGATGSFTVTALDSLGNTVTSYSGEIGLLSSDPEAFFPVDVYTFGTVDHGVHTFDAQLFTAGTQSISAVQISDNTVRGIQDNIQVNPAQAMHLRVSGFPSPTTAGDTHTFTVTAVDQYGNTVPNYTGRVHFTSSDANATVPGDYTFVTADGGTKAFPATLRTAGTQSITAADGAVIVGSQTGILVNAAAASQLAVAGYANPTTAGVAHSFTVTAEDAFGNVITGYAGTVHFTSSDGSAVLPGDSTLTGGTGSFDATLTTAGTQSIGASDGTLSGSQTGIVVDPAAASQLVVAGYANPTTAGVAHSFTVTAEDAFGNTATGYAGTLHFTSSDGSAVLPSDSGLSGGTGSFDATLTTAGTQSLSAGDGTLSGSQPGIVVNPAATSQLVVSGYANPTTAGDAHDVTVTAEDAYGNLTPAYTGTVHISSSDPQAALPADSTFSSASHTFSATLKTAGTQSITASDGTLSGSQTGIVVNPAATSQLLVSGYANPTTAGDAHTFTVTAEDAYGNLTPGYTGTVHISSSDPQAGLPSDDTFSSASHTFTATLKTAGTQSITASDGTLSGSQPGIVVNPAATSQLLVSGYANPTTAGDAHDFTVTAEDPYGNLTPAYTGTVHVSSSDAQAGLPAGFTFSSASHTFTATLKTAGTQTLTASDGTLSGSQTGIVVNPAATSQLLVSGYANPTTAGDAHNFTVTAEDAYGNLTPAYTGTVHISSSDPQAGLPSDGTFSSASHTFSATLKTAGTQSITASDGTLSGSQSGIVVNPAPTSQLLVGGYANPTTAGDAHTFTVTAEDAYGNLTPAYTGTVHVSSSDPQAALPADYTFNSATHTFTATLKTAGTQSITASDGTLSGSQTGIVVNPAPTDHLVVSAFPTTTVAGTAHDVTVTAEDHYGNTTPAYSGTVHFTSSDPQAVLPADSTVGGGTQSFSVTLKTAGPQSITATDTATSTITGSESGIQVQPAATVALTVAGYPSPTTAGAAHTVTVTSHDAYGNTTPAYRGTVQVTSSDPQAALPANYTFVAGDNGAHTFSATLKTAGLQSITATDMATPAISGSQSPITVNPAPASHYVVSGPISAVQVGTPFNATVTATDPYGNTDVNYTGTAHWASSDGAATLPSDYAFTGADAGVHTFTLTLNSYGSGSQTITATDTVHSGITGSTTVSLTKVPVAISAISATPVSPNTAVQFSDTVQLNASVDAASYCCGTLTGTLSFTVNGHPAASSVAVSQTSGPTAYHTTIRLNDAVVPAGTGSYTIGVVFTSGNANYGGSSNSGSAAVGREGTGIAGSVLTYTGDNYVLDTGTATLGAVVEQRDPAADSEYIDYSKSPVWVRFDVYSPNSYPGGTPARTLFAQVANASDWSTTGHGSARVSVGSTLSDGSYTVVANLVRASGSAVGDLDAYISGDDTQSTLTSSPASGSFVTGGGFIAPANGANTANTHGNFGITVKFNKSMTNLQGNLVYIYRRSMDVGGGTIRDVDVMVKSNSLSYLNATSTGSTSGTAIVTGKFSVQYIDAQNGTVYTSLGFGNGSFQLNVTDGGTGGASDRFGLALKNPDGTTYYVSSGTGIASDGSAQQVTITGGNITVHQ